METSEQLQRQQLIGVLLTSMGALALEVVLTRIFSVTMWYHFAFLAISLALMGSGTAGVVLYAFPRLAQPEVARRWIGYLAVLIGLCVPLTFFIYLQIPFRPVLMNRTGWFSSGQVLWLLLIYLDLALPFFLSGMILSLALSGWPADAGRIYWADLTGASLGCLASIAALAWLGGAGAVLAVGAVLALAGVAFTHGWALLRPGASQASGPKAKVVRVGALVLCVALVAAGTTNAASPWLHIRVNKAGGVEQPAVYERCVPSISSNCWRSERSANSGSWWCCSASASPRQRPRAARCCWRTGCSRRPCSWWSGSSITRPTRAISESSRCSDPGGARRRLSRS